MQSLIDLYKHSETLHHAYFIIGNKVEEVYSKLKHFLENTVGIKTAGNPDFWYGKFNSLTIDDARAIAEASERKSFSPGKPTSTRDFGEAKKIFIIQADFISHEAQNSLLKVFEEPTAGTHFFIISPQEILLPTLRSRMQVIEENSDKSPQSGKIESILNLNLKDRLTKVKEVTDAISDEESTKQDAISFLNKIEKELYQIGVEKTANQLKVCEEARASLYDRGAPIKIILENVMLSI